jgi:hypothetical protein
VLTEDTQRPKQLIGAKTVMVWIYYTLIESVDVVMLPPGETFDQSFFLASLWTV